MPHREDPGPPPPVRNPPAPTSRAWAECTVNAVGERLLVERLHRVLDEGGLDAHRAFCDRVLPYLQELVTSLLNPLHEDPQPATKETVRMLHARSRLGGVTPRDIIAEGIGLHDR